MIWYDSSTRPVGSASTGAGLGALAGFAALAGVLVVSAMVIFLRLNLLLRGSLDGIQGGLGDERLPRCQHRQGVELRDGGNRDPVNVPGALINVLVQSRRGDERGGASQFQGLEDGGHFLGLGSGKREFVDDDDVLAGDP